MIETFIDGLPARIHHVAETCMKEACARGLKLAVAESCTGGLLAAVMTDVEGCAHAFDRGLIVYTDEAKSQLLGVPPGVIARYSAVSIQTAHAMAEGLLRNSQADFGVSVTGFAGAGAPGEEPGLVYFGIARRHGGIQVSMRRFEPGSRASVRIASLETALTLLQEAFSSREPAPRTDT